jgi:hypothetical protein
VLQHIAAGWACMHFSMHAAHATMQAAWAFPLCIWAPIVIDVPDKVQDMLHPDWRCMASCARLHAAAHP